MSEIEIGIEIIPGKEEKDDDTILKLTEHSDCSKEKSRLNPFFVIQVSQGLNVCEITFNSFQARMATETFETLRNLDQDAFMLDQWCVKDGREDEGVDHGVFCEKVHHTGTGHLHSPTDDTPYDVDGLEYCGRCHVALPKGKTHENS